MALRFIYQKLFKRTSTFVLGAVVSSIFFERAYDHACESIFEWINEGRLWMHIKDRYEDRSQQLRYDRRRLTQEASSNKTMESNEAKMDNSRVELSESKTQD